MMTPEVFCPESAASGLLQNVCFQELDNLYCSAGGSVGVVQPTKPEGDEETDEDAS